MPFVSPRAFPLASLASPALALLVAACSSTSTAPESGPPARALSLSIETDVAAGSEIHKCKFVKVPADLGGHVAKMSHVYTPGSHHLVLFKTDLTEIPPGQDGTLDCYAPGREVMVTARGILYASQTEKEETKLPEGVGLPLGAESVLLLQAHYLNPNASPLHAKVDLALTLADEAAVREKAGVLFFYDPFIFVPPRARASAALRCKIAKDVRLLGGLSHMHKRGVGFEAFLDAPSGELATAPFYTSNDWDHPLPRRESLDVAAGSRLRFRCDYQNGGDATFLQGQSADTNEMCVFTALYHPAMEPREELCVGGADVFGAGDQTCSQSFDCIQRCPAGSAPRISAASTDVHECWQRCFASSCTSAGAPLSGQLGCVRTKCATDCADTTATACPGCVLRECGVEYSACQSHACTVP